MKRKLIASLICGALLTSTASVSAMTAETELKLETMAYFKPVYDTFKEQQIRFDYELEHGNPYDWWIKNLTKHPTLKLRRSQRDIEDTNYSRQSPDGPAASSPSRATAHTYTARAAPERCAEYVKLRRAKYGFSDQLIWWLSFSGSRSTCTPVHLRLRS